MTDTLICKVGPQPGRALYVLAELNNKKGSQAREPSKCLNGWSYGERLAKKAFWSPATIGSKKDSDRTITPMAEAVFVPAHLVPAGSPQAKQLCHFHAQLSLGQCCHRQKKVLCLCAQGRAVVSDFLQPCKLWPARLLFQGGGFSRQQYWSVLASTGCHTLLQHYISDCPILQLPWVPGAARTSASQPAAPPPHLGLTGTNPSPPGQPQEQTLVDHSMERWK